ncbi:MAG: PKD domain-containing protein, partial [Bacteroidota bacterium]
SDTYKKEWVNSQEIELNATPIFLTERSFTQNADRGCVPFDLQLKTDKIDNAARYEWTINDDVISAGDATAANPTITEGGRYRIGLTVTDSAGAILIRQHSEIVIDSVPQPAFDYYHSGVIANFENLSSNNSTAFNWTFGDGNSSTTANPRHVFSESGSFETRLTAENECGAATTSHVFEVDIPQTTRLAQTANDRVQTYDDYMRVGMNFGVYRGWTDEMLADISAGNLQKNVQGVGARAVRPALYDHNLATWGYDVLTDSYEHFANLNLKENTVIVGFPRDDYRDPNFYCPTHPSEHFDGLYLDIWDDGSNGTPINDDNLYAKYLYETVLRLREHVQFWEIWNEPSFDYSSFKGWLPKGERYSWWDEDPSPCDYKLRAPIQHFVRVLRISYEIIKTYDPDAYVTLSGVGFPSFLDALLRNTDNPKDGTVNATYPHGAGAYFDVMGFHSYPHFDGSTSRYDTTLNQWVYRRHSDAAAEGIAGVQRKLQQVLDQYGYDGETYPSKEWVITEINIPRKQIGNYIGSDLAQRNFMLKAYVEAMRANMLQFDVYSIGEEREFDEAFFEFAVMGLYKKLDDTPLAEVRVNEAGIALKTVADLLYGTRYDAAQTSALQLPEGVKGAALRDANGDYI